MNNTPQFYCLCNSSRESGIMVNCDRCEQWYHGMCTNYQPSMNEEEQFYCPLCICDQQLELLTTQIMEIVDKYVKKEVIPSIKVIPADKRKKDSVHRNAVPIERKRRMVIDEDYNGYPNGEMTKRLRKEIPTKRRQSERLLRNPRLILSEAETLSSMHVEIPYETETKGKVVIRAPNSLGDKEMNDYLRLFQINPRLAGVDKWIVDCVNNKYNITGLKILNPEHINDLDDWMGQVKAVIQSPKTLIEVQEMVKQQSLPPSVEYLFFEYIRLELSESVDATSILTLLASYVWYGYLQEVLRSPKETLFWKRVLELAKLFCVKQNSMLQFSETVGLLIDDS